MAKNCHVLKMSAYTTALTLGLFVAVAVPASYAGYKHVEQDKAPVSNTQVNWDRYSIEQQQQSTVYLRARLSELVQENEQLRNSIHTLKTQQTHQGNAVYDVKIQALVEENKRLSQMLSQAPKIQKSNENLGIYINEIQKLKAENQRLQTRVSAQSDYEQIISSLRAENARLLSDFSNLQVNVERNSNKNVQDIVLKNELDIKESKISSLETKLTVLENENAALEKSVQDISSKYMKINNNNLDVTNKAQNNAREIEKLNTTISKLETENASLTRQVMEHASRSDASKGSWTAKLDELQNQNEQLRETIKAQNEVLRAQGNASSTAEYTLSENENLKKQILQMRDAQAQSAKSAQDLFVLNEKLREEIAKRDVYLQKLEGKLASTETSAAMSHNQTLSQAELQSLRSQVRDLEAAAQKERDAVIAYRKKIKEYQDQMSHNEQLLTEKKLEVQDLKAKVELLSEQKDARLDVTVQKNASVTYVDTDFPPVDEVLPILDKSGAINNAYQESVSVEALLGQELKKLGNVE